MAMVATVPDSSLPPRREGTVWTVGRGLVYKCYAVLAVLISCATLASLRSAPILFHCLYSMIYWCAVCVYYAVCVRCLSQRRNRLTDYIYIVDSRYHSRRRVVRYRVVEENGQGAVGGD